MRLLHRDAMIMLSSNANILTAAMDATTVLDIALDQIARLQENVSQAVLPGGGGQSVQYLGAAEQNVRQLQQLSEQLQQLAAAVQAATPPVTQPNRDHHEAWATGLQDQAKQAAAALQQQVTTALSGSCPALLCPSQQQQHTHTHTGSNTLWHLLQRVRAAAPWLALHLFRSASDRMLCSLESGSSRPVDPDKRQAMDSGAVTHISAYVDEVRVVCPGVFVAAIGISPPGSLQPVRVCVDSADKASTVDPWTTSKHQVFKRISMLAVKALQHFNSLQAAHTLLSSPAPPAAAAAAGSGPPAVSSSSSSSSGDGVALEALLLWLASFQDLFSRPCDISGKVVTWAPGTAAPLPPYVRPYWLSLEGLREAAANKAARRVYHAHLAPWPRTNPDTAAAVPIDVVPNGSGPPPAAAAAAVSVSGSTATLQAGNGLTPWDTAEFTDDELRAQLRHVIGDVF